MSLCQDQADVFALLILGINAMRSTGAVRRDLRAMQYLVDVTMEVLSENEADLVVMRKEVSARMAVLGAKNGAK